MPIEVKKVTEYRKAGSTLYKVHAETSADQVLYSSGSQATTVKDALDSAVVHRTGNETISGAKTYKGSAYFSAAVAFSKGVSVTSGASIDTVTIANSATVSGRLHLNDYVVVNDNNFSKGTIPEAIEYAHLFVVTDAEGTYSVNRFLAEQVTINSSGTVCREAAVYANVSGNNEKGATLSIYQPISGTGYVTIFNARPSAGDSSSRVPDTAWVSNATVASATAAGNASSLGGVAAGSYTTSDAVSSIVSDGGYVTSSYVSGATVASAGAAGSAADASSLGGVDASAYALKSDIAEAVNFKGVISDWDSLPVSGNTAGDMYIVTSADADHGLPANGNVIYTGSDWDILGELFTVEEITTSEIDSLFA